jgi:hypothetical protein
MDINSTDSLYKNLMGFLINYNESNEYREPNEEEEENHPYIAFDRDFTYKRYSSPDKFPPTSVITVTILGREKQYLESNLDSVFQSATFCENPTDFKIYIVPDFINLIGPEFEKVKEEFKDIWESQLESIKDRIESLRDEVINMFRKGVDDYDVTFMQTLFQKNMSFSDFSEHRYHYESAGKNRKFTDDEMLLMFNGLKLINHWFMQYVDFMPVFNSKMLDVDYTHRARPNTINTIYNNYIKRINIEQYRDYTLDRIRGENATTLKTQNCSLLTQFAYEMNRNTDDTVKGSRIMRGSFEGASLDFLNEGKLL